MNFNCYDFVFQKMFTDPSRYLKDRSCKENFEVMLISYHK